MQENLNFARVRCTAHRDGRSFAVVVVVRVFFHFRKYVETSSIHDQRRSPSLPLCRSAASHCISQQIPPHTGRWGAEVFNVIFECASSVRLAGYKHGHRIDAAQSSVFVERTTCVIHTFSWILHSVEILSDFWVKSCPTYWGPLLLFIHFSVFFFFI